MSSFKVDPATIKPAKRGHADFFSWQLYRWVKKKPHAIQIWQGTWNSVDGISPQHPTLYIGYKNEDSVGLWFHGRMLRNLCLQGNGLQSYAYHGGHDVANWVDITEQWWADYMERGVCAIHGDKAHNWEQEGELRTCLYCGKKERRTVEMVEKIVWVKDEGEAA